MAYAGQKSESLAIYVIITGVIICPACVPVGLPAKQCLKNLVFKAKSFLDSFLVSLGSLYATPLACRH